jgi:class 3 adenylate cyclase
MAPQSNVQPSEELEHVTRRIIEAMRNGDYDALTNLFSVDECFIAVGTDDEEYWEGPDTMIEIVKRQHAEMRALGFDYRVESVRAFRDGPCGWSVSRTSFQRPDGSSAKARSTRVFLLVSGQWRMVHSHVSLGSNNFEVLGVELTTSLESLAEFAETNRPDLTGSTASDGTVTIVFTDIEASTEIAERLGDRRWVELLRWHEDIIRTEADRCDGSVVKSQGDGFMLAFSAASHALDFAGVVQSRTAIGNQGQPVRLRVGINTGDAIRDRDDFFGHAVTVAARVAAHALGGEVLATDLVVGLVAGVNQFRFGDAQTTELKGLSGTYVVRPLLISAQ